MVESKTRRPSIVVITIFWLAFSLTALIVDAYVINTDQELIQPRAVIEPLNTNSPGPLTPWGLTYPDLISTYFYNQPYENKFIENNKNDAQIESGLFGQPLWDNYNNRKMMFSNLIPPSPSQAKTDRQDEEKILGDQSRDNDPLQLIDHITGLVGQNYYYYNPAQPIVIKFTEISGLEPVQSVEELFLSSPTSSEATTTTTRTTKRTTTTQTTNNPTSSQDYHFTTNLLSKISIANSTNANLTELKLFKTSRRLNKTNSTNRNETTRLKLKPGVKSSKFRSESLLSSLHKNLKDFRTKLSSTLSAAGSTIKSDHSFLDDLENDSGVGKLSNERLIHKRVSSSDSSSGTAAAAANDDIQSLRQISSILPDEKDSSSFESIHLVWIGFSALVTVLLILAIIYCSKSNRSNQQQFNNNNNNDDSASNKD